MRFLIVSAMLAATVSCAWMPPPAVVTAPPPSPPPIALTAPPPPPPVAVVAPAPSPFWPLAGFNGPPGPGRLTLSNFNFDNAHVEVAITTAPDCGALAGTPTSDFVLPLNGTRIIQSPPGADICWRRAIEAETAPEAAPSAAPSIAGWTGWSRAFLSSGRSVDAQL